ncbi:MAG: hypothetical protein E6J90_39110 [Deltaproteobacteria bacterium]|nr:MAG: hypothetical protein E6J90_39110 [Deltaproteobacteria bacterium]
MTPRPHDALFKSAFETPAHAAALLRALVPTTLGELIAWDTLTGETGSFVDPRLADRHSDLVFSARLRAAPFSVIYVLLEHQSTGDPTMPLRTMSYEARIWHRFRKAYRATWLPPILAVVISHVRGGWTTARTLAELFDPAISACPALAALAALVPRVPLIIEDLAHRSNADLRAWMLPAFPKLALWLLRDARDPRRLLASFDTWIDSFAEVERASGGSDAMTTLLTYLFRVVKPMHHDELRAKVRQLGPRAEEITMSIVDMWHEQGRAKGRQEGRVEGRIAALRRLILVKFGCQMLDDRYEAAIRNATLDALDGYLQRVLTADSVAAVFED